MVDAERLVSAWLRTEPEIVALVGDRVYTAIPSDPTWPLVRLTRIGGAPVMSRPLHLDRALLQFDAFGGPKAQAHTIAETCRMLLASPDFIAAHADGVVTAVEFGVFAYLPDPSYTPARPRYVFDAAVYLHP